METGARKRAIAFVVLLSGGGCASDVAAPTPNYDAATRRLIRLDVDTDRDGRIDTRTYLDGNRPLRTEVDADRDGRVDRWEWLDEAGQLVRVGTSSANDGVVDTWTLAVGPDGTQVVELSRWRDGRVDRREHFRDAVLDRAEEDASGDGRVDKWELWEAGALRRVEFDTTFRAGRPDRRFQYDEAGQLVLFEADLDGDGRFEPVTIAPGGRP